MTSTDTTREQLVTMTTDETARNGHRVELDAARRPAVAASSTVAIAPPTEPVAPGGTNSSPLAAEVAKAVERERWHDHPALYKALDEVEVQEEIALVKTIRKRERAERNRLHRSAGWQRRADAWHNRRELTRDAKLARAAAGAKRRKARSTSPDARIARLAIRSVRLGRATIAVILASMTISALVVQQGLAPQVLKDGVLVADTSNPLYYAGFLFEALVSGMLVLTMMWNSMFAEWGRQISRFWIITVEAGLLAVSLALTVLPHLLAANSPLKDHVWMLAVPPIVVAGALVLHNWGTVRAGQLLDEVLVAESDLVGRAGEHTMLLIHHAKTALAAMHRGDLPVSQAPDGGGVPAAGRLATYLGVDKGTAGEIRDVMKGLVSAPQH